MKIVLLFLATLAISSSVQAQNNLMVFQLEAENAGLEIPFIPINNGEVFNFEVRADDFGDVPVDLGIIFAEPPKSGGAPVWQGNNLVLKVDDKDVIFIPEMVNNGGNIQIEVQDIPPNIPEPHTVGLLGAGLFFFIRRQRLS